MISFENVTKIFNENKENECKVLDSLNLTIKSGEFVSLRGRSGSGKSTIMKLVALLEKPTSGKIIVNNENIGDYNGNKEADYRNKIIGYVVQDFMLIDNYKAYENVMLPLSFKYMKYSEKKALVTSALETVGMLDCANKYTFQLSGGEKQRIAIARAIVNDPKIILADEPTGSLDKINTENILNLFKNLNSLGKTILIVTHDDNVAKNTDREIEIEYGKVQ